MKADKLKKSFDKYQSAEEQYRWLIGNHKGIKLILDNDQTWVDFGEDKDGESVTSDFYQCLGNSEGISVLLDALGIKSEHC